MASHLKQVGVLGLLGSLGLAGAILTGQSSGQSSDAYSTLPNQLNLTATVRDFKAYNQTGGHPDFEAFINNHCIGMVAEQLDSDNKPVASASTVRKVNTQYTDSSGRNINPLLYDASKGDRVGALATISTTTPAQRGFTTEAGFAQWYRDVPNVNLSKAITLTLNRVSGTNRYVFDSDTDAGYVGKGGFFPINGDLYGNYNSTGKNFHFTTEVNTVFTYERNKGQVFTFTGDDDVWVFINNRKVIDIGGVHGRTAQTIDLDRLPWLVDGTQYSLRIFNAERHTTQSNFRIETTLRLQPAQLPSDSALAD